MASNPLKKPRLPKQQEDEQILTPSPKEQPRRSSHRVSHEQIKRGGLNTPPVNVGPRTEFQKAKARENIKKAIEKARTLPKTELQKQKAQENIKKAIVESAKRPRTQAQIEASKRNLEKAREKRKQQTFTNQDFQLPNRADIQRQTMTTELPPVDFSEFPLFDASAKIIRYFDYWVDFYKDRPQAVGAHAVGTMVNAIRDKLTPNEFAVLIESLHNRFGSFGTDLAYEDANIATQPILETLNGLAQMSSNVGTKISVFELSQIMDEAYNKYEQGVENDYEYNSETGEYED